MTKYLDCPTCGGMHDFRLLNHAEKAAVRATTEITYVHDLWRCTVPGCVRFQRWDKKSEGGLLPEEFREKTADTK